MRPIKTCHHVKENGKLCEAAALRGRDYCYFHAEALRRGMRMAQARRRLAERSGIPETVQFY